MKNNKRSSLFRKIKNYKKAVYELAQEMYDVKESKGRKVLADVTTFGVPRIDALCVIGKLSREAGTDLLPESLLEFWAEGKVDSAMYEQAKTLKPTQIRQLLRSKNQTVKSEEQPVKVNGWCKQILLLENELKKMKPSEKVRALSHLTNTILDVK